jgi:hypothetical protein
VLFGTKKEEAKLYTQVLAGVKHLICLLSLKNKYNMISLLFAKAIVDVEMDPSQHTGGL